MTQLGAPLVLCLLAASLAAWPGAAIGPERIRRARPVVSGRRRGGVFGAAAAAAVIAVAPELWVPALLVGIGVAIAIGRGPPGRARRLDRAALEQVAVACDLLAAGLDAGLPIAGALRAACSVLNTAGSAAAPRPRAGRGALAGLESVALMLDLGADPEVAWRPADETAALAPLAAAARRSARGGTALAEAVRGHAGEVRERLDALSAQSAGRAAVLMTAPLAVCFLPGFICLGLAPVVIGLLGQLDIQRP